MGYRCPAEMLTPVPSISSHITPHFLHLELESALVIVNLVNVRTKISLVLITVGAVFWFLVDPTVRFEVVDTFSYEIDGKPHDLGKESRICNILEKKNGVVRISILVTPNALRNWQNIFQTSDMDAGIRLEIDENGYAEVGVAGATPDSLMSPNAASRLSVGKQSTILLFIANDSGVTISIDGVETSEVGVPKPKCDRLRIGVGFDDSRGFDGTGSIMFETGSYRKRFPIPQSAKTLGQILVILVILESIMWAVGGIFTRSDKNPSGEKSSNV